jgi:hypothetical protein
MAPTPHYTAVDHKKCIKPSWLLAKKAFLHWQSSVLVGLGRISVQEDLRESPSRLFRDDSSSTGRSRFPCRFSDTLSSFPKSNQLLERLLLGQVDLCSVELETSEEVDRCEEKGALKPFTLQMKSVGV